MGNIWVQVDFGIIDGGNSPLTRADNPPGEWNQFLIRMVGDKGDDLAQR